MTKKNILLGATAFACGAAFAGPSPEDDELALIYGRQTISLATGSSQPLRRAPAVASVVTADDIAALGLTDLDEAIETVAGVHVTRTPITYSSAYLFRGIGGGNVTNPQVLVLLNGVPLTSVYAGDRSNSWSGMPLGHVARIEVLRGPGSALYGADAFAGVINIITKSAADMPGTHAAARVGSYATREASVSHGGKFGGIDVGFYLHRMNTDGHRGWIQADAQTLNDSRFGTKVSLAPGPMETSLSNFDASLDLAKGNWRWRQNFSSHHNIGEGAGVNSALDNSHHFNEVRNMGHLSWFDGQLAEAWSAGMDLSYYRLAEYNFEGISLFPAGARIGPSFFPDGMIGGPSRFERSVRFAAHTNYSGWVGHGIRIGLGHDDVNLFRTETYKNFLLTPAGLPVPTGPVIDYGSIQPHIAPHRRNNYYAYAQDEWHLARDWTMTWGVRHDRYSDFGGTTNPRLALVWDASVDLTFKLLHGRAFRAPSFNELYGTNPVNSGNPDAQPEKTRTTEGVMNWQATSNLNATLAVFHYDLSNLIRTVANPAPAPGSSFKNIARIKGDGAELELAWDIARDLRWTVRHSWQAAQDQSNGADPGYAPRRRLQSRLDWRMGDGWTFTPSLNRVMDRRRAAGDARAPIADYTLLDANLVKSQGAWTFALAARNVFNADAREPSLAPGLALPYDLPLPGRNFALTVERAF